MATKRQRAIAETLSPEAVTMLKAEERFRFQSQLNNSVRAPALVDKANDHPLPRFVEGQAHPLVFEDDEDVAERDDPHGDELLRKGFVQGCSNMRGNCTQRHFNELLRKTTAKKEEVVPRLAGQFRDICQTTLNARVSNDSGSPVGCINMRSPADTFARALTDTHQHDVGSPGEAEGWLSQPPLPLQQHLQKLLRLNRRPKRGPHACHGGPTKTVQEGKTDDPQKVEDSAGTEHANHLWGPRECEPEP